MFKTEESRVAVFILATFALLLMTGVYPQYVLGTTIAFVIILLGLAAYGLLAKKKSATMQDERSALCSLRACRNGFAIAIILMALLAAAVSLGATYSVIVVTQIVWGLSMATYFLSYLYYKNTA